MPAHDANRASLFTAGAGQMNSKESTAFYNNTPNESKLETIRL